MEVDVIDTVHGTHAYKNRFEIGLKTDVRNIIIIRSRMHKFFFNIYSHKIKMKQSTSELERARLIRGSDQSKIKKGQRVFLRIILILVNITICIYIFRYTHNVFNQPMNIIS